MEEEREMDLFLADVERMYMRMYVESAAAEPAAAEPAAVAAAAKPATAEPCGGPGVPFVMRMRPRPPSRTDSEAQACPP